MENGLLSKHDAYASLSLPRSIGWSLITLFSTQPYSKRSVMAWL